MKNLFSKITYLFFIASSLLVGCNNDHEEWENGDPALAHVYYYCFEKWGSIPGGNDVSYSMRQGETIEIPTQFYSNFTRKYSPMVYYYTAPKLPKKMKYSQKMKLWYAAPIIL